MRHLLYIIIAIFSTPVLAAAPQVFESACGPSKFQVSVVNNGHPLDNTFTLSTLTPSAARELFKSEEGGWFYAACMAKKDRTPVLVFQSYCGGSGCLEAKYGAIDASSLKPLLLPSSKNIENDKQLSKLLGYPAPHLGQYKKAFCCGE